MWGVVLAAGRGERMLPISSARPKPSLPFKGTPIIRRIAESLLPHASKLVANLHHLPQEILRDLQGLDFGFSLEGTLLGTCGGLRRILNLFNIQEEILLHNGDTLLLGPYEKLINHHRSSPYPITLALCPHKPPYTPLKIEGNRLKIGEGKNFYCGAMVISPEALENLPPSGNLILDFAARFPVGAVEAEALEFTNPSSYFKAHGEGVWTEPGARIHPMALVENSIIMRDGRVERGAAVVNSVVVRGTVPPGKVLKGGIFVDGKTYPLP